MFHSKSIDYRLNKICKRILQLVQENSCDLTFEELLPNNNSVIAHQKNSSNSSNLRKKECHLK